MVGTRVTVTSTPTELVSSQGVGFVRFAVVRNKGAVSVDIGGATVATGAAFELAPTEWVSCEVGSGESLYGVTASGTCRIDVLSEARI